MVAAARREPAQVIGDGARTIEQLVAEVNKDPRRRPGHGNVLTQIELGGASDMVLAQQGIVGSMSRRGNCWDNAVAESFFATLKVELVHDATWSTRTVARTELFEYIEIFYNGQRRHSALAYLSPRAFERRREQEALAT